MTGASAAIAIVSVALLLCAQPARAGVSPGIDGAQAPSSSWLAPSLQTADYRIGSDDVVSIEVLQASELNTSARVSEAGEISLPLLGKIRAIGLTTEELEQQIEDRLRERYIRYPDVTVRATEIRSHAVSVAGAVSRPGVLQIRRATTLLEVISLAGGVSDKAGDTVLITRKDGALLTVDLKKLMESTDPAANPPINPGDVVNVQTAAVVYVLGAVNKPGAFSVRGNDRMTILRAIALGEGLMSTAAKANAVVLRADDRGQRVEIAVDLAGLLTGKAPDVGMEPQDVLFVPTSGAKVATRATLSFLARIITLRGVIP